MRPRSLRPYLPTSALRRRAPLSRRYAVQTPGALTLEIFNQHIKYLQKERAASNTEQSRKVEYLRDEVAQRLCERLLVRGCPPSKRLASSLLPAGHPATFSLRIRPWCQQLEHCSSPGESGSPDYFITSLYCAKHFLQSRPHRPHETPHVPNQPVDLCRNLAYASPP